MGRAALAVAAGSGALTGLGGGLEAAAVGLTRVVMVAAWAVGRWRRRRQERQEVS